MNWLGMIIGAASFVIIGIFHPIVIKCEYYFGARVWPVFGVLGLVALGMSLIIENEILSGISGVLGFCLLWSILELRKQEERVRKGWFPSNPKRRKIHDIIAQNFTEEGSSVIMAEKTCVYCHKPLSLKEAGYPMGSALLKADRVHVDIYECPECGRVELFAAESDLVTCPVCGSQHSKKEKCAICAMNAAIDQASK